jgi:hypothetical protein
MVMTLEQANQILDEVKVGIPHPPHIINQALITTGDLKP